MHGRRGGEGEGMKGRKGRQERKHPREKSVAYRVLHALNNHIVFLLSLRHSLPPSLPLSRPSKSTAAPDVKHLQFIYARNFIYVKKWRACYPSSPALYIAQTLYGDAVIIQFTRRDYINRSVVVTAAAAVTAARRRRRRRRRCCRREGRGKRGEGGGKGSIIANRRGTNYRRQTLYFHTEETALEVLPRLWGNRGAFIPGKLPPFRLSPSVRHPPPLDSLKCRWAFWRVLAIPTLASWRREYILPSYGVAVLDSIGMHSRAVDGHANNDDGSGGSGR